MIVQYIEKLKSNTAILKKVAIILGAVLMLWSVIGVDASHGHTWAEKHIPGFWALFGITSCAILVFVLKLFGATGIQKREDYYDN